LHPAYTKVKSVKGIRRSASNAGTGDPSSPKRKTWGAQQLIQGHSFRMDDALRGGERFDNKEKRGGIVGLTEKGCRCHILRNKWGSLESLRASGNFDRKTI